MGALGNQVERRLELLLQEDFPKCPRVLFFLLEKILVLNPAAPYTDGPVLSHSSPLQLDWGLSGLGPHMFQFSTLPSWHPQSPCVYHFVLIPLLATSSNQISLGTAQALFAGEGAINSALSQESCCRPGGRGPEAAVALVSVLVPGTFLS